MSPEKLIGRTHRELNYPEEICILTEKALDKVINTGEVYQIKLKSLSAKWIDWLLSPEFDETG